MEYFDEILLEQYFSYINMKREDRNRCINYLLHTKELSDSEMKINNLYSTNYDLVSLYLNNNNKKIDYSALVSGEGENRTVTGIIKFKNDKVIVDSFISRLNDVVSCDDREYSTMDIFTFENGKIIRKTIYEDGKCFESEVVLMTDDEVEEYLQNKVNKMRRIK